MRHHPYIDIAHRTEFRQRAIQGSRTLTFEHTGTEAFLTQMVAELHTLGVHLLVAFAKQIGSSNPLEEQLTGEVSSSRSFSQHVDSRKGDPLYAVLLSQVVHPYPFVSRRGSRERVAMTRSHLE